MAWLRERKVLLPGVTVLARLVAECRDRAAKQVHVTLRRAIEAADVELPDRLIGLLRVPEGARFSELERLRRGPTRVSGRSMPESLHRVSELAGLGAGVVDVSEVLVDRFEALAREGLTANAQAIDVALHNNRM